MLELDELVKERRLNSLDEFNSLSIDDLLDIKNNRQRLVLKPSAFNIEWSNDGSQVAISTEQLQDILYTIVMLNKKIKIYELNLSEMAEMEELCKNRNLPKIDLFKQDLSKEEYERLKTTAGKVNFLIEHLKLTDINAVIWSIVTITTSK